jgi:hypothetical protein
MKSLVSSMEDMVSHSLFATRKTSSPRNGFAVVAGGARSCAPRRMHRT